MTEFPPAVRPINLNSQSVFEFKSSLVGGVNKFFKSGWNEIGALLAIVRGTGKISRAGIGLQDAAKQFQESGFIAAVGTHNARPPLLQLEGNRIK